MQSKTNTLMHTFGFVLAFTAFMGLFGAISLALMFIGIYWAFQLTFSVGWWAGAVTFITLLAVYITALNFGLGLLRKGDK